jgi:ribonuclease T1
VNRTVMKVGGVITAVAVVLLLAYTYVGSAGAPQTAAPETTPAATARTTSSTPPPPSSGDGLASVKLADLPVQARQTVALIDAGGPFPYAKDGATFNNFEGVLPSKPRGYYREYTVMTPGERDRGARRIVTGDRDRELFYTADHYETFARVQR